MGVLKSMFGGMSAPKAVETAPTPQAVDSSDTGADTEANTKKKKRAGFTSTRSSSLLEAGDTGNRTTLG